jgi:hypothetical protein
MFYPNGDRPHALEQRGGPATRDTVYQPVNQQISVQQPSTTHSIGQQGQGARNMPVRPVQLDPDLFW